MPPGDAHPGVAQPAGAARSGDVRPWLHRLVARACIDQIRRRRRGHRGRGGSHQRNPTDDDTGQTRPRPARPGARPPRTGARAVVVLHFYLDQPLPQVAANLGIPVGTAKSRLHRSLGIIRSTMAIDEVTTRCPVTHWRPARMTMGGPRIDRMLPEPVRGARERSTPAYLEAAIERASSRPQRPAWTFPGRSIPMQIATRAAPAARAPWRRSAFSPSSPSSSPSRPTRTSAPVDRSPRLPFGPAGNGVIALERDGDIVRVDPATGAITRSPAARARQGAAYSRDGTDRLRAARQLPPTRADHGRHADGTGLVQATPEPLSGLQRGPSRRTAASCSDARMRRRVELAVARSRRVPRAQPVDISLPVEPDGSSRRPIARPRPGDPVVGNPAGSPARGIYIVDAGTGKTQDRGRAVVRLRRV